MKILIVDDEKSKRTSQDCTSTGRSAIATMVETQCIGSGAAMRQVKAMIPICAQSDANVLLCGETGAGKDMIAALIHRCSHRRGAAFVKTNCAGFSAQLIESELFGHCKGAFTGALLEKAGRFELAEGGTLYLDDVDDVPLPQQVKLLRVVEEKLFERVGGKHPIAADVRIVSSTKARLLDRIAEAAFREDLYYRLNVLRIDLPPLRERLEDLPMLVEHFLRAGKAQPKLTITPEAIAFLQSHNWPGNIRELRHAIERASLLCTTDTISAALLARTMADMHGAPSRPSSTPHPQQGLLAAAAAATDLRGKLELIEHKLITDALTSAGGNKSLAARQLNVKDSTFRDKLAKYGLV